MLSVTKLAPGQESYYLRSLAVEGSDGEPPGRWLGAEARFLGLPETVSRADLRAVLGGRHPGTGAALRDSRHPARVPGFELTFSAPKSVSVLAGLGGEEGRSHESHVADHVDEAQGRAVAGALGYLERSAARARRGGAAERRLVPVEGLLAAAFTHHTSRAGDPHVHTHVLVANLVRGADGRWTALSASGLFAHARTAAALHAAHLRGELTRRLGLAWIPDGQGGAQVAGIDPSVLRAFSRRGAEVRARMAEHGATSARGAEVAALDTRPPKDLTMTAKSLSGEWRARAETLGLSPGHVADLLGRARPARLTAAAAEAMARDLVSGTGPLAGWASFDRRDVLRELCERLVSGAGVDVVERIAGALLASDLALEVAPERRPVAGGAAVRLRGGRLVPAGGDDRRWTAKAALAARSELMDLGARLAEASPGRAGAVEAALDRRPGLSVADAASAHTLAGTGAGLQVVSCSAWTDTAAVLDAARDAWETVGRPVVAVARSPRALDELEAQTSIAGLPLLACDPPARTDGPPAPPGAVILVLEAHLLGARDLVPVLRAASAAGGSAVLIGDRDAVPEHDTGDVLGRLGELTATVALSERLAPAGGGDRPDAGCLRLDQVTLVADALAARERLVADWWAHERGGGRAAMVAPRRRDVAELNGRARALMEEAGVLTGPRLVVDGRDYRAGDRMVVRRPDRGLGLSAGARVVVTDVNPVTTSLSIAPASGDGVRGAVDASRLRAGLLLHAYAVTPHDLAGESHDAVLLLGDAAQYRAAGWRDVPGGAGRRRMYTVVGGELASAPQAVLRPLSVLVEERDRLAARLQSEAPAPAGPALDAARGERLRAIAALEAAAARRRDVDGGDDAARPERHGGAVPATARADERRWAEHVGRLESETAALVDRAEARDRWERERGPERARLAALGRAVEMRSRFVGRAAAVCEPAYLTALVGPRPRDEDGRRAWMAAALSVETYRERWKVDDPVRALGAAPGREASRAQRSERDAAEEAVRAAGRSLGLVSDRGQHRVLAVEAPALARQPGGPGR